MENPRDVNCTAGSEEVDPANGRECRGKRQREALGARYKKLKSKDRAQKSGLDHLETVFPDNHGVTVSQPGQDG